PGRFRAPVRAARASSGRAMDLNLAVFDHPSVVLNGLRKVKRFRRRETDLTEATGVSRPGRQAEPDLKRRLAVAIDGLPDGYRTVFVMHDVEGYTHEEIGAALGIETGTSKAQLSRARARLRAALADFAGAGVSWPTTGSDA